MINYNYAGIISLYSILTGSLLLGCLALFAYLRNKKSKLFISFALSCLSLALILFNTYIMFLSKSKESAIFWDRNVYIGAIFFPTFLYQFSLVFTKDNSHKKQLIFGYFLSIIFLLASRTDYFVKDLYIYTWGVHTKAQILHHFFLIFFSSYILMFLFNIFKFYKASKGFLKEQTKYILIAFFILLIIGPMAFLPSYGVGIYPFPYMSFVIFSLIIAYAIVRHRLMDIRLLVLKSVVYSLSLTAIAGAYISITILVFNKLEPFISHIAVETITLFALIFTFNPLRKFIEKYTDRLFSKGCYNFNELLGQLNEITKKNSRSIDGLTNKVIHTLTEEMRINKAAFILTNSAEVSIRNLGFESKSKLHWDKPIKMATNSKGVIVYDELEEDSIGKEILRKVDAQVLIPIKIEKKTEAILVLGEKKSGDMYTTQDLNLLELIAPQIGLALENAKSFQEKEQRIKELDALNTLALHVSSTLHLDKILDSVLEEAIGVTTAEAGSIMLLDEETKTLSIKTAKGISKEILATKIKVGEGIAGTVAKTEEPLNIDGQNTQFEPYTKRGEIASSLSVPLKVREKLIGVLNVNRRKNKTPFTEENLHLMASFASQAAEAIDNAHLYEDLEKSFMETISALAAAVDAKDHYTYGHSEAITEYSTVIAKEIGLTAEEIKMIKIASKLHDVGKIGVEESILNKPGKLSDDERKIIEEHPKIGVDILKNVESLKSALPLILYHHERIDGKGYPTGLPGTSIPLGAKIMAIADSFHAMNSDRPYRKALPLRICIEELRKNSGTQFDAELVECFIRLIDEGKFKNVITGTEENKIRLISS